MTAPSRRSRREEALTFDEEIRASSRRLLRERFIRLRNSQRTQSLNARLLEKAAGFLLDDLLRLESYDLTIHLINAKKMTELNETILRHVGSTDVITFDYSIDGPMPMLAGEIIVCVDEALSQAREFRTTWQSELVRYLVHGVLHLQGFDDLRPGARLKMKREENRRLAELSRHFDLSKLARKPKVRA